MQKNCFGIRLFHFNRTFNNKKFWNSSEHIVNGSIKIESMM